MAIIDSYSESSYLADQVVAHPPHPSSYGSFADCCSNRPYFIPNPRECIFGRPTLGRSTPWPTFRAVIIDSYSESSYLADQVLADLLPHQIAISQIPCSDSSYFIPTLRVDIWQIWCWQIYPPHQMAISQIPALTAHISFPTLSAHIWQTSDVDRSTPPSNCYITDSLSDNSYFIPTLRVHIWQTKCWQIYPPLEWQFHRFLLWQLIFHSYSESSYLADQLWTDLPPHQMVISQIAALTAHISCLLWGLIFGRPGVGRSTPCIKWFHRLTAHDSFSLWELIFGRPSVGRSTPSHPSNGNYRFLLWELIFGTPVVGRSTPPSNSDSTDCCSDSSYFLLTLRAHIWQTRMFRSTSSPTSNSNYRFLLWELIFGRPSVGSFTPSHPSNGNDRFLLWRAHICQTRMGRSTPSPYIKQ